MVAFKKTFEDFELNCPGSCYQRYRQINIELFKNLEKGLISSLELRIKRFELLFSEFDLDLDTVDFSNEYLQNLSKSSMLIDGAFETIFNLYPEHKMILVTNGIADVQRPRFDNSNIMKYYENVIITDEIGVAKPATKFFDIAFRVMGEPLKKDVMIKR